MNIHIPLQNLDVLTPTDFPDQIAYTVADLPHQDRPATLRGEDEVVVQVYSVWVTLKGMRRLVHETLSRSGSLPAYRRRRASRYRTAPASVNQTSAVGRGRLCLRKL
jgi:hypothetical protein